MRPARGETGSGLDAGLLVVHDDGLLVVLLGLAKAASNGPSQKCWKHTMERSVEDIWKGFRFPRHFETTSCLRYADRFLKDMAATQKHIIMQ